MSPSSDAKPSDLYLITSFHSFVHPTSPLHRSADVSHDRCLILHLLMYPFLSPPFLFLFYPFTSFGLSFFFSIEHKHAFSRTLVTKNPQRSSAGLTDIARCKLSVIADATANLSLSLPVGKLLPYDDHFHPTTPKVTKHGLLAKPEARRIGHPMVGVNILPHEEQVIGVSMLEKWDFCLRRLFVLKTQSLKIAIGYG